MNPAAGLAEPPALPAPAPRRWPWIVAAAVATLALLLTWTLYRPFPTAEERRYVGWWYGATEASDGHARAWAAEFRDDGQLKILFRSYGRDRTTGLWRVLATTEETGSWRVRDGVQHLSTEDATRPANWFVRYLRLRDEGSWRRQHYYQTDEINERELRYHSLGPDRQSYRALHAASAVVLPEQPLAPEQWPKAR